MGRISIIVNGRHAEVAVRELTFENLVSLAFPGINPLSTGSRSLTVTYRRGPADRPEGSLVARENVRVLQGEVFNVTATDKS
ncbi:multiubiquitin domain-containing protein [Sphingomonas beigongshangi]|uniref:multiubiquitin domain-containing protein n=1 Tax=Sphingomonas beigongshangi TaxID=2782540 RepID=UPI001AEEA5DC|nr:multiubiquitin domain-containing protein [Sphingomonas beigongshangi]